MNTPTYYTLTELAHRLGTTSTAAFKRMEKVSVVPIHSREVNGRTYRMYGPDAAAKVDQWIEARSAKAALLKARKEAAKQRKVARTLKKANAVATAAPAPEPAGGIERGINKLAERIDLLVTAVDVLSRRVDSLLNQYLRPVTVPVPAIPWPVVCDIGAPSKEDFVAGLNALSEAAQSRFDEPTLVAR